jgi:hypothetical protein
MPASSLQKLHFVKGIDPVLDFNDTTQYTQGVNSKNYSKIVWIVYRGVGTGTATITVLAGSDAVTAGAVGPTASTAVPFKYKLMSSTDIEAALVSTTAAIGVVSTACVASQIIAIEFDVEQVGSLTAGYQFMYLKFSEVTNSGVVGSVAVMCVGGRFQQDVPATAVT